MIKRILVKIFATAARRLLAREKPTIIAITGSYGKSSVKEAIAIALGAHEPGSRVKYSTKNYNNEFGLPFSIFGVAAPGRDLIKWIRIVSIAMWMGWGWGRVNADVLVLEMGSDHPGDLAWLTGIARPNIAVITSVAESHAEHFGSIDEIAKEKATLIRALPENGAAVLNNDDPRVTAMRKECKGEAVYYGLSEGSDVRVLHTCIVSEENEAGQNIPLGIKVVFQEKGKEAECVLRGTVGRPHALAAACGIAVARLFDIPSKTAIERLERDDHGMPGRTRILAGMKGSVIIDDSYNAASPRTVISLLEDASRIQLANGQRRIALFGEMLELGLYSEAAHREVGEAVVAHGVDMLVLCGTLATAIGDAAFTAGMDRSQIRVCRTSDEAGRMLREEIKKGDIILVKGSQGSRMEKAVKELMAEPQQAPFLLVRMSDEWQKIK